MSSCKIELPVQMVSMIACASFSTEAYLISGPYNVQEKNTTRHPFWLRVAAMANCEASVSTSKGTCSSMAHTNDSSMSLFSVSKAVLAFSDIGKLEAVARGCIFSEKHQIH